MNIDTNKSVTCSHTVKSQVNVKHTPIYQSSLDNPRWNIEHFFPKGFYVPDADHSTLHGLLTQTSDPTQYQWVHDTPKVIRGYHPDGSEKYIPYDYPKLLTWYVPHLLHCFWFPHDGGLIIQVDRKALAHKRFRYRFLTVNELRAYIWGQHKRARYVLDPFGNSVIDNVFNTKWMEGTNLFPLSFSKSECQRYLPQWFENEVGFTIPICVPALKHQKIGEPIQGIGVVRTAFAFTTEQEMNILLNNFEKLIGQSLTVDQLHETLDGLGYRPDVRKGRVTTLIRELRQEGIELKRHKKRDGKKLMWIYKINRITVQELKDERVEIS